MGPYYLKSFANLQMGLRYKDNYVFLGGYGRQRTTTVSLTLKGLLSNNSSQEGIYKAQKKHFNQQNNTYVDLGQ